MTTPKQRRLEKTVTQLSERYGTQKVYKASELSRRLPPHVPTGFAALDGLTGCGGMAADASL